VRQSHPARPIAAPGHEQLVTGLDEAHRRRTRSLSGLRWAAVRLRRTYVL